MKYKAVFSNSTGKVRLTETFNDGRKAHEQSFNSFHELMDYCKSSQINILVGDFTTED